MKEKIKTVDELLALREQNSDKKIVLCHGTFDICHPGHILHLQQAKDHGDILVVTITGDKHVRKRRKTFFSEELRASHLASLEMIDYVCVLQEPTAVGGIRALKPNTFAKGKEYTDFVNKETAEEQEVMAEHGGVVIFTDTDEYSSTKIGYLSGLMSNAMEKEHLAEHGSEFVDLSPSIYETHQLQEFLDKASKLKVLVIGEEIQDVWVYDNIGGYSEGNRSLSGKEINRKVQLGGSTIIASHLADFVFHLDKVNNNTSYGPQIVKTRFLDAVTESVVYHHKDIRCTPLEKLPDFSKYDVVIVSDFGHGFINHEMADEISFQVSKGTTFLAVQCQTNMDNYGFNTPRKYGWADYFNMNRLEAEFLLGRKVLDDDDLIDSIRGELNCEHFSVTLGADGAFVHDRDDFSYLQNLSRTVVDTIGCGDAFFALVAIALAVGMHRNVALLLGQIAAAIMVQCRGNDTFVEADDLKTIWKVVT